MKSLPDSDEAPKKSVAFFVLDFTLKGGVERFVANMSSLLNGHGIQVTIYSFHRTNSQPFYLLPPEVEVVYLSSFVFRRGVYKVVTLLYCFKLLWLSYFFTYPYVAISTSPIITIFLSWFSRVLLKHTVASEHSTYLAHSWWIRALRVISYRGVKCVVTQTNDGWRRFANEGIPNTRISLSCTNFHDTRQWTLPTRSPSHPFTCLSVGRFESVKQLDHYIEMAHIVHQQCPDIRFELVGSGPLETQLRRKIQHYRLEKVFHIHSPTTEVNIFYAEAQVYLITSESESFSMTMIEALSYGVPVISYDGLVGPSEIIQHGHNGFLCKQNSPEDLAARVLAMYQKPYLYQDLTSHALQSAQAFNSYAILQQWLAIL